MSGITLRFAISVMSMITAFIAYMTIQSTLLATVVIFCIFILSAIIERALWYRFTDKETRRRDLEDRVRNPPL